MDYQRLMADLATSMVRTHGSLKEVIFMSRTNYISLLVFSNGIVLPTFYSVRYDEHWMAIAQIVNTFKYIDEIAGRIDGKDPLSLLTFGYGGTGSKCFAAFLGAAGFLSTGVEEINPPLKLRPDGSRVRGTWRGATVQWEDGSQTPEPYGGDLFGLLGKAMVRAHGALEEVIFLEKENYCLLSFADKTVLPTSYVQKGDERWLAMAREVNYQPYLVELTERIGGQVPLELLEFNSSGFRTRYFSKLLSAVGFTNCNVEKINPPLRLKPNGSQIHGMKRGAEIEWEDGSKTPVPWASDKPAKKRSAFWSRLFGQKPPTDRTLCFICGRAIRNATERVDFLCTGCGSRAVGHDSCLGVTGTARIQFGTAAPVRCPSCGRQA